MSLRARRIASDEAHAWARNLRLGNPQAKLILSMITLYFDGEGCCFVGIPALAEDCEMSPDTVRRRLAWLESIGVISHTPQWIDSQGLTPRWPSSSSHATKLSRRPPHDRYHRKQADPGAD